MHRLIHGGLAASPLAFALALALASGAAHAQNAPGLQQRMGAAAFHQAGLDKLSPAELQALQQWLAAHAGELSPVAVAPAPTARAAAEPARQAIVSHVEGRFIGWQPGSVLVLANGQHWRVVDDSALDTGRALQAPVVTVKPGLFGGWLLKVAGYNTAARVQPAN